MSSATDVLPTVDYPPVIRGSLRLILQLKDAFLSCFNLVEEYRDLLLACQRGFTRNLVLYQLTQGLAGITRLREDLANIGSQSVSRLNRNAALRQYLLERYTSANEQTVNTVGIVSRIGDESGTGKAMIGPSLPPPVAAPDSVEAALHGGLDHFQDEIDVDVIQVPEEIDLATTVTENGTHLLPVVEFYRGFYFLQMHFQLIMCQAVNYAMPVVTRPMGLAERAFSWPSMPSFGLASSSGSMRDRLLEINADVHQLVQRLLGCLALVREKLERDKRIEAYFLHHTSAQEGVRRNLLRALQAQRIYIETLEGQNDRLAGLAIKLDPSFAKTSEFATMTGPGDMFRNPTQKTTDSNLNQSCTRYGRKDDDDDWPEGGQGPFGRRFADNSHQFGIENTEETQQKGAGGRRTNEGSLSKDRKRVSENDDEMLVIERSRGGNRTPELFGDPRISADGSELDVQAADANMSASGGGPPPVWVRQSGSSSHKKSNQTRADEFQSINMNEDMTKKLDSLRGHSQAVEELLIGIDSVASHTGNRGSDLERMRSPSFLNTEHYVTSLVDDPMGPSPIDTNSHRSRSSVHNRKPVSNVKSATASLHTLSTKYSQAELLSPTISVSHRPVTVQSVNSSMTPEDSDTASSFQQKAFNRPMHNDPRQASGLDRSTDYSKAQSVPTVLANPQVSEVSENTDESTVEINPKIRRLGNEIPVNGLGEHQLSTQQSPIRNLNTNANASEVVLPRIVPRSKQYRCTTEIRSPRSASSSTVVKRTVFPPTAAIHKRPLGYVPYVERPETMESEEHWPTFEEALEENKVTTETPQHAKQVPLVGATECGGVCMPEWVIRRGSKTTRTEDLLKEPKRSAINRALITHRCRLVETILQADEEKLEELISLLLKE
ncbi:unnamed protein product [Calicophoron daubneyi]|uniref:DUF5743 domain-containing protein n=1 Tax=Calicophoron daubneyi TaxID=300641 RepID=A0AAV2TA06_CALDB